MFATAAIVDAVRKEDRRRELDRQLDEARRELSDLRDRGPSASLDDDSRADLTIQQMDALWRSLKAIYSGRPFMKEIDKPATVSVSELVSSLKSDYYGCPGEASMRGVRQTDYERLERAVMAEETDESILSREARNRIQLFNESSSIEHLVRQLLRRAEILDQGSSPSPSFDEARELAESGHANFTFRSIDPGRAKRNTSVLNRRLRSLVDAPKLGLKERIGRVCYNLLVSAHPPDMHTYNTLIVAFDKAGHHSLADALVHSFFHERLLRPTPYTFVAILNHYKATNNHGKFLRALACLTGADSQTGAKISRRHVKDIENSPVLRNWAADTQRRTRTGDWVLEHVPLNRALVEEVITGLLHFKLFDEAATFFVTCMRSGVAVSSRAAKQVLDECIMALDWKAAVRLIRGFTNNNREWRTTLLTGDEVANSYLVSRIYALLDLCGLHTPGQSASKECLANLNMSGPKLGRFLEALEESRLEPPGLLPDAPESQSAEDGGVVARSKSRLLQMESIWKEYVAVRRTTISIESKLLYPQFPVRFRTAMALHIGGAAAERSMQLSQDFAELVESDSLPRNEVPEWASSYINYKGLKKLVKAASEKARNGEAVDPAELFFALDRNLEDVDSFYNKKFAEACRRLNIVHNRYGRVPDVVATLDQDEVEEVMGALLELRTQLRNLQWFGEINRRGFVKITKKLDKKVPDMSSQHSYMSTRVDPKPFAKDGNIARLLVEINRWLSVLGDARNVDDSTSDRSTRSLGRASAKAMINLPQAQLDALEQAVRSDDVATLRSGLDEANVGLEAQGQSLLLNLLQRSISARSRACIAFLLTQIKDLAEPDDINGRNCIHRLVIHVGRTKSAPPDDAMPSAYPVPVSTQFTNRHLQPAVSSTVPVKAINTRESKLLGKDDEAVQLLIYLFDQLSPDRRHALRSRDSFGRLPLHYAAQFGFVVVCQIIMERMQRWNQFDAQDGIDAPEWQDNDGYAPLHLGVIGGHPLTTQALLQGENWQGSSEARVQIRKTISKSGAVLALATKSNYEPIVEMLVDAGVDINWTDKTGESALHVAARFGHVGCARVIVQGSDSQKANLEIAEETYSWTPLHVAAVDGFISVVQLLIEAGADVSRPDASGWTAKEHAALRGHMDIARLLASHTNEEEAASLAAAGLQPPNPAENSSIDERRSNGANANGGPRPAEPVKSFGHRYLTDESLVLVSLGSMDIRKSMDAVTLDRIPLTEAHSTQLDTALSVVISANGAQGEPTTIDLPVHESIATEPVVLTTRDAAKVKLLFDIVPTYSGSEKNKIGRAVALLSSIKPTLGTQRMNLQGDVCVPILSSSLEVIGTVNFNFLVITPFHHPNMEVTSRQTYWKKLSSTMLIGHRGLGKNVTSNKSLQLGENTLPSFIAAANLGAQYVEFDVQLTKDHVPVIYHDFLVSETGIDAPVHTLTLEQFLHINPDSRRDRMHQGGPGRDHLRERPPGPRSNGFAPKRSLSMGYAGSGDGEMEERMKHTRDFKAKGYKANSRGNFIQAPFATLEDLFCRLPEDIGFNIELKYPMLHESEQHEMDTYAVELNWFCDTVLSKVYDLAGQRHIIFSSFNPDICLCLSFKQPSIPILFLTDAGCSAVGDIRASSLQEAIRFASRWNLLGIVSAAEPLINSPRLVKVVKELGLVCVSYGVLNNDPTMVQRQVKQGIDAVIVDSVLAIRKGLTSEDSSPEQTTEHTRGADAGLKTLEEGH
ncbi:Glycerophosphodiester phosphodiesterase [Tolypocladium capitatum]|uniref:Glycerophosphodiester phosphodiesterase n=1 Tax=Tolypocladium capitatum TaxID=45235 RepID=A0A2K3QCH1_9HYPO|nr:Glycerophosphodiester phosphodiesterase [Tolypocladium capitatum]